MEKTNKKNWIVSGLLVLTFVFGLFTFLGVKAPEQKVYATESYVAGSELKIETTKGGTYSTTFAGGKYLHLDPIDKNHYTNNISSNADMEYDETTGVLKIFKTYNTFESSLAQYISVIATNETDKNLTIEIYFTTLLPVLDFRNGNLTLTTGEDVTDVNLYWRNKMNITGKLTIAGNLTVWPQINSTELYPELNSLITAYELELLDSSSFKLVSGITCTCALNVKILTLNTDGYLTLDPSKNNDPLTLVLRVEYEVNLTKCTYIFLYSSKNYDGTFTNNGFLLGQIDGYRSEITTDKHAYNGQQEDGKTYRIYRLFDISYDGNGGTGTMSGEQQIYYKTITLPDCTFTAPQGKQFAGWAVGSVDETPLKQANDKVVITESITIYAIWEDIPAGTYTVSFNSNGGTGTMTAVNNISGSYTLPACTFIAPEGKQFAGWALSANGAKITTAQITISENTELFALWKDVEIAPEAKGGLSAGAVVAIVLSSLIVLGVGGFAVYWFVIKKKTWADFVKATKNVWNKFINLFKNKK